MRLPGRKLTARMTWALLFVLLFACKIEPVDEGEIPGTYRAQFHQGTEELILRPDGTFDETFTYKVDPSGHFGSPTGASYQNSGRWRCSLEGGEPFVLLDRAIVFPLFVPPNRFAWRLKSRRPYGRSEGVVLDREDPDRVIHLNREDGEGGPPAT